MSRTDIRRGRTEGAVRLPDRGAGVSRGHSRSKLSVRSSGTLARKGRNSQGSHDRERAAEGPNDREGESDSRLRSDRRPKIQHSLAFLTADRGEPSDAAQEGTESPLAKRGSQSPASGASDRRALNSIEPPCTDPYARWCGRGGAARLPPIPLNLEPGLTPSSRAPDPADARALHTSCV
jgi:hypothetical protein